MAFCFNCGKEIKETDIFCPSCGQKINNSFAKDYFDPFDNFISGLKKYFTLSGCATRKEFWLFYLYFFILQLTFITVEIIDLIKMPNNLLQVAFGSIFSSASLFNLTLYWLSSFFFFIPIISIWVRRMHDANKSGWWILCPFVNIIFLFFNSKIDNNKYHDRILPSKKQLILGKIFIIVILIIYIAVILFSILKAIKK